MLTIESRYQLEIYVDQDLNEAKWVDRFYDKPSIKISGTNQSTITGLADIMIKTTEMSSLISILLDNVLKQREVIKTLIAVKDEATFPQAFKKSLERSLSIWRNARRLM